MDVRGEICPFPMMKATDAMKAAKEGEVIEMLTDHPPALLTIPNQAVKMGWDVNIERTGSSEWKLKLTKSPVSK
jgi:TusA-related sulfurtransferase